MNVLTIRSRDYPYEIDGQPQLVPVRQSDFVVDGEGLGLRLGFEGRRPWFGRTCFELIEPADEVEALRGLAAPSNQLGSGRFVLYGCHCGSDYCGVVSCVIERRGDLVVWCDARFEVEAGDTPPSPLVIEALAFPCDAYDAAIAARREE